MDALQNVKDEGPSEGGLKGAGEDFRKVVLWRSERIFHRFEVTGKMLLPDGNFEEGTFAMVSSFN